MCKNCKQRGLGINYFKGEQFQKGYGIGGLFKRFVRWVSPFVQKALPVLKEGIKHVGKEVVSSASNIAKDVIDGHNFEESSRTHLSGSIDNLKKLAEDSMVGKGYKRKRSLHSQVHSVKKRKYYDLFSRK